MTNGNELRVGTEIMRSWKQATNKMDAHLLSTIHITLINIIKIISDLCQSSPFVDSCHMGQPSFTSRIDPFGGSWFLLRQTTLRRYSAWLTTNTPKALRFQRCSDPVRWPCPCILHLACWLWEPDVSSSSKVFQTVTCTIFRRESILLTCTVVVVIFWLIGVYLNIWYARVQIRIQIVLFVCKW